jgi:hypothetical protein
LFRTFLAALLATLSLAAPVATAGDESQLGRITTMSIKELDALVSSVAAVVNQDTLRMRNFAQSSDCLDLIRAANSFALASTSLTAVREAALQREDREVPIVLARAVQTRVTTFAARVRAEEWLGQRCRNFAVPAEHADDPRYFTPVKVSNADYTEAVIDARQTAETNLAIAIAAGNSGKCSDAIAAGQNISLLLPYLQKLHADTARRPQVLGPRASRRALDVSRRQLVAALDKLQLDFGTKCRPQQSAPPTSSPPPATDAQPAP